MTRYAVILGSLDTKGEEVAFLRDTIRAERGTPLVVDTGVLGTPTIPADVTRHQVAVAAGSSIMAVIAANDKAQALVTMAAGASKILGQLFEDGQLAGVISIGGSRGTALSTRVMQTLPVGIPKLMVSTMATGQIPFGLYVGTKDVTMMPSVADILGVNSVTRPILTNAAAAIVAMSRVGGVVRRGLRPALAASILGASTPLVEKILALMDSDGFQVIAFHAVGTGGRSMEELIDQGLFDGVFDVTPTELVGWVVEGPHSAGPDRMRAAGRMGIPQVIAPGGLDFIIEGPPDALPARYEGRKTMNHTPTITLVRTSPEELAEAAHVMADRLAQSTGPSAVVLPLRGFSRFGTDGQPLYDPKSDRAFVETFKAHVPNRVQVVQLDTDLNDQRVADTAVRLMGAMLSGPAP